MGKRMLGWFTTMMVVISLVGTLPVMTANAAGVVQSKVNYVVNKWNGAAVSSCQYSTSYGGCASQCYGFVKHATEYIFGADHVYSRDNGNNAYTYIGTQPATNDVSYLLKTCKPGDVLNCGSAHTALVVSNNGTTMKVIQRLYASSSIAYDGVWIREGSTQSSLYLTANKQARTYDIWRSKNYKSVDGGASTATTLSLSAAAAPSFGTPFTVSVGSDSAYIKCTISRNGSNWTEAGAYFGTSTSKMTKIDSDKLTNGYTWVGYDLPKLTCATTYYYKFYIIAGGKTYWSSVKSFKTSGHKYKTTVVSPTYLSQGYTLHKCSVCGHSYKDNYTAKLTLGTVANFKASSTSVSAIKLTWSKTSGATGYIIYKYDNSKKTWVRIAKIASNSYTASNLSAGTTYKYAVKAYKTVSGKEVLSPKYPQLTVSTNPAATSFSLIAGSSKAAVKWNKVTGASGYIVYYKTSANSSWQRLTSSTGTSYTKTDLAKGKTYYFTVKAYKKLGTTTYNGAFTAKSVKIK